MEILTSQEIAKEYKVSMYFIRAHRTLMGGRGKPARFARTLVDAFFHGYFREELEKQQMTEANAHARAAAIEHEVARFVSHIKEVKVGQIQGKFSKI